MNIQIKNDRKLVAVVSRDGDGLWLRGENYEGCVFFGGKKTGHLHNQSLESMVNGRTPIYEGDVVTITF